MPCVLVLLVVIGVGSVFSLEGFLYPPFISKGGEVTKMVVGYNIISIRTLSLLAYFTYISMDIIIYALGSTSWSFRIF
jgi:hypothetical protein